MTNGGLETPVMRHAAGRREGSPPPREVVSGSPPGDVLPPAIHDQAPRRQRHGLVEDEAESRIILGTRAEPSDLVVDRLEPRIQEPSVATRHVDDERLEGAERP